MTDRIHEELKKLHASYADLESFTGLRPLMVTELPQNTFQLYKQRQQGLGVDITKLKPAHINPDNETMAFLLGHDVMMPASSEEMVAV